MGKYNLLDEPWISVVDGSGHTREVSLKDVFENAHSYRSLAGDMETQNFAVMRVLLAVMHTVFSRFDAKGEVYECLKLDDKYRQINGIEEEDLDYYTDNLFLTWFELWNAKEFPNIITEYLEKWRDRFYLFDDIYPFFQVSRELMIAREKEKLLKESNKKTGKVFGKNINYLICESENKTALFSPKYEAQNNKELLTESQIVRWLITYHGYTGTGGKQTFRNKNKNESWSKGWIYDIGGVYFKKDNLFETLMLNFVLVKRDNDNLLHTQKPCWEFSGEELVEKYLSNFTVDNISELYTNWSRAVYIDCNLDLTKGFECIAVKLLEVNRQNNFIEPLTVWKYNKSGENKDTYTPKKHLAEKAMWRSFGMIVLNDTSQRRPGVIDWLNKIQEKSGILNMSINIEKVCVSAITLESKKDASSIPIDEIIDYLLIDDYVLTDLQDDGWVIRINDAVEKTKRVIGFVYKNYIVDIKKIRNIHSDSFGMTGILYVCGESP